MLKVNDKDYLENGKIYIEWNAKLALLVFYDGYMYQNIALLFSTFKEETKSLSKEKKHIINQVKGWNHGQVICSVLTTLFNQETFTIANRVNIYNCILFAPSPETKQTVFLFIKNNYFFVFSKSEKKRFCTVFLGV